MTTKRRCPLAQVRNWVRQRLWGMFWLGPYLVFVQGRELCWQYLPYTDKEGPWWELRLWPPRIKRVPTPEQRG